MIERYILITDKRVEPSDDVKVFCYASAMVNDNEEELLNRLIVDMAKNSLGVKGFLDAKA